MTTIFIWKLGWNGHIPWKMFLIQTDLRRNRNQTIAIRNKGSESVVRKTFP